MIRNLFAALGVLLLTATLAFGQAAQPVTPIIGPPATACQVSATCPMPISGSFSATLSGFAPGGAYANVTSNATTHSVALPAGTTVVVFNTGTTAVSCHLSVGAASAVANENVIQPGSWLGFTVGSNNTISCINQAGDSASNVVVISGGTGLPTGAGGGSSGGSSSNASVGTTGAAVPGSATYVGINVAGNLTGWTGAVTQATAANLNATVVGTGTFAVQAAQSGTWTVQSAQSGTWTVQPGNTANTTPWLATINQGGNSATVSAGGALKVDNSAVTQPISAASLPLPSGASTSAKQPALGTAGSASADVITVQGIASMTPVQVSQATSSNLKAQVDPLTIGNWGLQVSTQNSATPTNGQLVLAQFNTTPTTISTGNVSPLQVDNAGNLLVNIKAGAGSGGTAIADNSAFTLGTTNETPIGCYNGTPTTTAAHVGIVACTAAGSVHTTVDNTTTAIPNNADAVAVQTGAANSPVNSYAYNFNGTSWDRQQDDASKNLKVAQQATATGGASTNGNIAANNTTAVVIKASAGTLYGAQLGGIGSVPAYLKIYNATSATCGSGTPVKRLIIPAAGTAANGAGSNVTFGPQGVNFGTGITYCITAGIADSDTTAPAANTYLVNLDWQ